MIKFIRIWSPPSYSISIMVNLDQIDTIAQYGTDSWVQVKCETTRRCVSTDIELFDHFARNNEAVLDVKETTRA